MATWFWINVPAMVAAFALMVGLPLRMVLKDAHAKPVPVPVAVARTEDTRELIGV